MTDAELAALEQRMIAAAPIVIEHMLRSRHRMATPRRMAMTAIMGVRMMSVRMMRRPTRKS
jgi:hypothetical protein